ncbi:MAG: LamG domain-containing protein [Candidatus Eremiobacteraeota bacterium]|nr:LamG domain-containing protein [Candidatus Eremiobacteraeota bacterium]
MLAKGPVGFWRFDERSGAVAHDASGHGHVGTYHGGVWLGQVRDGEPAIDLNGTNAFVEVSNSSAFSQATSGRGLTVEAWMRPDVLTFAAQTDQRYIHWLGKGQAGAFEWGFRFYSNDSPTRPNRISAYIWNLTSAPGTPNEGAGAYFQDALEEGEWIHVAACYDPGDANDPTAGVSIYKNGELRESPRKSKAARYASYDIHPAPGGAPVRLGTRDLLSFLHGGLADVAIYPRVLTASEILDNYLSP